ncbi:MAG: efflux RND transporter periplasmic adaptor subunit [Rhodobacteraceae bacterium]|nr:efflux RND transporter periplasmic adaptor subunit [Paracoccaceae bacterium]
MKWVVSITGAILFGSATLADVLEFEGMVHPSDRGIITTRIDGVVETVFHQSGAKVTAGAPLIQLDETDARLVLDMAKARLKKAEAGFTAATVRANRLRELQKRGLAAEASASPAVTDQKIAEAQLAVARAEVAAAQIALNRAVIRAPISGVVSKATAIQGMFIEVETNQGLGEVIVIDPVLVAYDVAYDTRLTTMAQAGVSSLEELFERLSVSVSLMDGTVVRDALSPERASHELNDAGKLTVWLRVPNPDQILRPGLKVRVTSKLSQSGASK